MNATHDPDRLPASGRARRAPQPSGAPPSRALEILAVEDEPEVLMLAGALLRSLGHEVEGVATAAEALARLATRRFDLLFTDIILPDGLDGYQLAQRALAHQPDLAVLYASGYSYAALGAEGRLPPGVLLLPKPYLRADLERGLAQALAARAGGAGPAPDRSLEGGPDEDP